MAPTPPPRGPQHSRVRRRTKQRQGPPRFLVVSVVVCGLLVAIIPLGHFLGLWRLQGSGRASSSPARQQGSVVPLVPDSALKNPTELVISEAFMQGDGAERRVGGKVRNTTNSRYVDIHVLFTLRSRTGRVVGTAVAQIDEIPANSLAPFQTQKVPPDTARQFLRDISGTRR